MSDSMQHGSVEELQAKRSGIEGARFGHALAHPHKRHHGMIARRQNLEARAESKCTAGGLYLAPAQNSLVPSANETTISWDNACLDKSVNKIDIYLYAPQSTSSTLPIHLWPGIPADKGSYNVKLRPRWWNATAEVALALNIVPSGNEPWDSLNPVGPTWSANYIAPTDGSKPPADALPGVGSDLKSDLISAFYSDGELTKSGMTAAIVCPLVVVLVALGVWVRKLHINRNNKTVDWAEHMDKRMSRISLDWTSGGDGAAGPTPGSRPASFMRPQSQFGRQSAAPNSFHSAGNMAGRGAGTYEDEMAETGPPASTFRRPNALDQAGRENRQTLTQSRISFAASTAGDRISRISYGQPSSEGHQLPYARGHKSSSSLPRIGANGQRRSAYNTDSYHDPDAPALPKLPAGSKWQQGGRDSRFDDSEHLDDGDLTIMSPTQHQGATPLGNGDIDGMRQSLDANRALGSSGSPLKNRAVTPIEDESDRAFRNSVLAYPALSMVTGGNGSHNDGDGNDMFAAMTHGRPISGLSEGADSAYAPTEQTRASEYIDHAHYAASGAPTLSANTGMAPAGNHTSPDEALKQYAALRNAPAGPGANTGGMRTLYTPEPAAVGAAPRRGSSIYIDAPTNGAPQGHRQQGSVNTAGSSINEDDVVGYNDMEHFNARH